jgi:hypothetical protein
MAPGACRRLNFAGGGAGAGPGRCVDRLVERLSGEVGYRGRAGAEGGWSLASAGGWPGDLPVLFAWMRATH